MSQELISVHADPIWRDRADFIVHAPLPEADRLEQLWCRQLGDDTFEVCCIPFFLYDMALGDTVRTSPEQGREYVVMSVLECSGRFVFRVYFSQTMRAHREAVVADLRTMGALLEWSSPSLLAVDAEDAHHGQRVADYPWEQEKCGCLVYETGDMAP